MAPKLNSEPIELELMRAIMPLEHQAAFDALAKLYSNSSECLINGMMDMCVRAAILAGVSGENFAKNMKHHWDYYADEINRREQ